MQLPSEQEDVRRLRKEVHRLQQENAFLKSVVVSSIGQRISDVQCIGRCVKGLAWTFVE